MNSAMKTYIVHLSPLFIFFVLLWALHFGVGFGLVLSLLIAIAVAGFEYLALKFVFDRVFPDL